MVLVRLYVSANQMFLMFLLIGFVFGTEGIFIGCGDVSTFARCIMYTPFSPQSDQEPKIFSYIRLGGLGPLLHHMLC